MEKYIINGGKPLKGEVFISGAKNSAVALLPATVLANDVCVLENVCFLSVHFSLELYVKRVLQYVLFL